MCAASLQQPSQRSEQAAGPECATGKTRLQHSSRQDNGQGVGKEGGGGGLCKVYLWWAPECDSTGSASLGLLAEGGSCTLFRTAASMRILGACFSADLGVAFTNDGPAIVVDGAGKLAAGTAALESSVSCCCSSFL